MTFLYFLLLITYVMMFLIPYSIKFHSPALLEEIWRYRICTLKR